MIRPPMPAPYAFEHCRRGREYVQDDRGEWFIDGGGTIVDCATLAELQERVRACRARGDLALPMRRVRIRWEPDPLDEIEGGDWTWDTEDVNEEDWTR